MTHVTMHGKSKACLAFRRSLPQLLVTCTFSDDESLRIISLARRFFRLSKLRGNYGKNHRCSNSKLIFTVRWLCPFMKARAPGISDCDSQLGLVATVGRALPLRPITVMKLDGPARGISTPEPELSHWVSIKAFTRWALTRGTPKKKTKLPTSHKSLALRFTINDSLSD
ncbi:hypothetical protein RRG08_008623 [Elysia crispata]|uniref:Uncharacterized protein n=1 Tax=Elysia crispata TaxID=231223 RepID=A0AAE1B7K1_9GAST|nr:hypothetical protein RRG08_008623 [Elysia crispata]